MGLDFGREPGELTVHSPQLFLVNEKEGMG